MSAPSTFMRAEIDEAGAAAARQLADNASRLADLGARLRALGPSLATLYRAPLKLNGAAAVGSPLIAPMAMIHRFYGLAEALSRRLGRDPDHSKATPLIKCASFALRQKRAQRSHPGGVTLRFLSEKGPVARPLDRFAYARS